MKFLNDENNSILIHVQFNDLIYKFRVIILDVYGGNLNGSLFIKELNYKVRKASTSTKTTDDVYATVGFNEIHQAENFINASRTWFFKYLMEVHKAGTHYRFGKYFPWMGECINPRTGLKGYESEWTNEDFYTYFNITKEEQEIIEKTMEKYK